MKIKRDQAWLFTFVDLAFLLMISLSLVSGKQDVNISFSEMNVPEVPDNQNVEPVGETDGNVSLRVYMVSDDHPKPFGIVRHTGQQETGDVKYLDSGDLLGELEMMRKSGDRPLLVPAGDSLSRDLLFAAGSIARVWPSSDGGAVVRPLKTETSENQ